jgi:hypothetical protein
MHILSGWRRRLVEVMTACGGLLNGVPVVCLLVVGGWCSVFGSCCVRVDVCVLMCACCCLGVAEPKSPTLNVKCGETSFMELGSDLIRCERYVKTEESTNACFLLLKELYVVILRSTR